MPFLLLAEFSQARIADSNFQKNSAQVTISTSMLKLLAVILAVSALSLPASSQWLSGVRIYYEPVHAASSVSAAVHPLDDTRAFSEGAVVTTPKKYLKHFYAPSRSN